MPGYRSQSLVVDGIDAIHAYLLALATGTRCAATRRGVGILGRRQRASAPSRALGRKHSRRVRRTVATARSLTHCGLSPTQMAVHSRVRVVADIGPLQVLRRSRFAGTAIEDLLAMNGPWSFVAFRIMCPANCSSSLFSCTCRRRRADRASTKLTSSGAVLLTMRGEQGHPPTGLMSFGPNL